MVSSARISIRFFQENFRFQLALVGFINFSRSLVKYEWRYKMQRHFCSRYFGLCLYSSFPDISLFAIARVLHTYEYTVPHLIFLARSKYESRYRCCNRNPQSNSIIHSLPPLSNQISHCHCRIFAPDRSHVLISRSVRISLFKLT